MSQPLSVRVDDETHAIVKELVEKTTLQNKTEVLEKAIKKFAVDTQIEESKKNANMLSSAMESIEVFTKSIQDAMIGAAANIAAHNLKHEKEIEDLKQSCEKESSSLKEKISDLEKDKKNDVQFIKSLQEDKKNIEKEIDSLNKKIENLSNTIKEKENIISDKTSLINNSNLRISHLAKENDTCKKALEENKSLKTKINEIGQENKELQQSLQNLEKEKEILKDKLALEKDAAILELKKQHQTEIETLQSKHSISINNYENRMKELLNKLSSNSIAKEDIKEQESEVFTPIRKNK